VFAALMAGGCAKDVLPAREPSTGHLRAEAPVPVGAIPAPVGGVPVLPPPRPAPRLETYTVVVNDVPVRELLFALARDAKINVDIHPEIRGNVTLNAVNQTLPQILERLSDQVDVRYQIQGNRVLVAPDAPYLKTYKVDYLNLSRKSTSSVSLSTEVSSVSGGGVTTGGTSGGGGTGGGRSGSSTDVTNTSDNEFWANLVKNLQTLAAAGRADLKPEVVAHPEAGVVTVLANDRQHRAVQEYLERVLVNARRQVMIEATIVEVVLNDAFQAGIDWFKLAQDAGVSFVTGSPGSAALFGGAAAGTNPFPGGVIGAGLAGLGNPYMVLNWQDPEDRASATLRLLQEFGDTRVLSSPRMMALNNQTAVLKVVENVVYFEITEQISQGTQGTGNLEARQSRPITVPVGIVMQITPQISEDRTVILTVRPTISRVRDFIEDPVNEGNQIPQLVVRELDSVLQLTSGQVGVLGGLMQDEDTRSTTGIPILSSLPGIGGLFRQRDDSARKTELVVFLRPIVIEQPSLAVDLASYRPYLDQTSQPFSVESPGGIYSRQQQSLYQFQSGEGQSE
jgi:general secretion pathway protein D